VGTDPQINLFLARDAGQDIRADIEKRLGADRRVKRFVFVPRDKALADLGARMGTSDLLVGLSGNPLPDAFLVATSESSETAQGRVAEAMRAWPGVDSVDLDPAWSRRLRALVGAGEAIVLGAGLLLSLAMLAICFNTIRLQVLTRSEETTVLTIFGATPSQIRRPFLYLGALQGLAAGLFAWGAAAGFIAVLEPKLGELIQTLGGPAGLAGLPISDGLSLVAFAGAVGALGAWLAGRN
jgi:cell division transport system permease protein